MKLSIVISVYNTSKEYLRQALESIKASSLSRYEGEYEICMVDDGSDIDYSDLISEFKVNAIKIGRCGILSARKTGIKMAKGEYITFCDADDTVSSNYHAPMLELATEQNLDIVINDWAYSAGKIKYYCKNDITIKNDIDLSGHEILTYFLLGEGKYHSLFVLWNKLYRGEILKKAVEEIEKAACPEKISYGEDALINFFAWKTAKSLKNVHSGYYFYRIHENQAVNSSTEEKLKNQISDMATVLNIIESDLSNTDFKKHLPSLDGWRGLSARYHYSVAQEKGYSSLYECVREQYKIKKLKKPRRNDKKAYFSKKLLPDNFDEVDKIISGLFTADKKLSVKPSRDEYTKQCLEKLVEYEMVSIKDSGYDVEIPRLNTSLKHKVIYNPTVYRLGTLIFRKKSKIRNKLKKHV